MANIETVTLGGTELKVEGLGGQNTAIFNKSDSAVYASAYPNIVPEGDNVIEIPAGIMTDCMALTARCIFSVRAKLRFAERIIP